MAGRTRQRGLTATSRAMAIQRRDPQSLLNWTGRIIRMRKKVPEVGWGDFAVVPTENDASWSCATRGETTGSCSCTISTLSYRWYRLRLDCRTIRRRKGRQPINLLSEDHSRADKGGRHLLVIEGYGYRWYRVGGLDYLAAPNGKSIPRRSESQMTAVPAVPPAAISIRRPMRCENGRHQWFRRLRPGDVLERETHRYCGFLIAALPTPFGRMVMLND